MDEASGSDITLTPIWRHDRMQSAFRPSGRVAQWQSSGLLSHWLRVRISPRSQHTPPPCEAVLFYGWLIVPDRGCYPNLSALTKFIPTGSWNATSEAWLRVP